MATNKMNIEDLRERIESDTDSDGIGSIALLLARYRMGYTMSFSDEDEIKSLLDYFITEKIDEEVVEILELDQEIVNELITLKREKRKEHLIEFYKEIKDGLFEDDSPLEHNKVIETMDHRKHFIDEDEKEWFDELMS